MTINVLGVNHKSAPIDIREKLVFDKHSIPKALEDIKNIEGVNEVVLISTCNRTEIYTENDLDNSKIIKWLSANHNSVKDCEPFMYNYYEEKAVKHLFNVASGVDSASRPAALCNIVATCLLYTSPSPRDGLLSRMPSSA